MHHSPQAKREVRTALRNSTRAVHERLHQAEPFAALARKELDSAGYSALLRRIASFHFTVGPGLGLAPDRRRLLARDLEALESPAPDVLDWSAPETEAARLGWAYVVEGSAIGGKILYAQLDYLFGTSAEGRLFFRGGATGPAQWRDLCGRLEAEGGRQGATGEMIAGAKDAFALFERALLAPVGAHG